MKEEAGEVLPPSMPLTGEVCGTELKSVLPAKSGRRSGRRDACGLILTADEFLKGKASWKEKKRKGTHLFFLTETWVNALVQRLGLQSTIRPRGRPRKQQPDALGG